METEDGDFVVEGFHGSAEDAKFDELVGIIEDFMISLDMDEVMTRLLPPFSSVTNDHEKHQYYRQVLEEVEKGLDAEVLRKSTLDSMSAVATLLQERKDEISDDVWEFVSDGCFDFTTFIEKWESMKEKK